MEKTPQRVSVRRITQRPFKRAEIFSISPRKALMEQLEARGSIQRDLPPRTPGRETASPRGRNTPPIT